MTSRITLVAEPDLADLLPLMREYCAFYEAEPADESLLALSRALLADPSCEGFQLIARDGRGRPVGFATVYWSWSTLAGRRTAILNDLFVRPEARGSGLAEALIEESRVRAAPHAGSIGWQTAKDNLRAQRVYDRIGARREEWVDYSLDTGPPRPPRGAGEPL